MSRCSPKPWKRPAATWKRKSPTAERDRADRRKEALLLVSYNLAKLNLHITSSRRILNDLRTLRRLLLAERGVRDAATTDEVPAAGD